MSKAKWLACLAGAFVCLIALAVDVVKSMLPLPSGEVGAQPHGQWHT